MITFSDVIGITIIFILGVVAQVVSSKRGWAILLFIVFSLMGWAICIYYEFGSVKWVGVGQLMSVLACIVLLPKKKQDEASKKHSELYKVELIDNKGKKHHIEDLNRGVAILGASGAGKTESIIQVLCEHYALRKFCGVIHDYKDFELSDIAQPIFKKQGIGFHVFAIHRPEVSTRINPIAPRYIDSIENVRTFVSNFFLNVKGEPKGDPFWRTAPEGILVAMIWRMYKSFPKLCNLSFITAILLQANKLHKSDSEQFGYLYDFLKEDPDVATKASAFITSEGESKLTVSIYSSLMDCLQNLDSANVLYLLAKDEFDLDITQMDIPSSVLAVVNQQSKAKAQAPINAAIIDVITNLIKRNSRQSFVLLEEAPTIKIEGLEQRIATLRSYGVSFVYCVQDMVQGLVQYGGKDYIVKAILANLSTQFFGKVNDGQTGEYYEKFFEFIKEKQYSFSQGDILSGSDNRINKSFKEQRKVRGHEFLKLKQGEFVMVSNGNNERFRFKYNKPEKIEYQELQLNNINKTDINTFVWELLKLANEFVRGGYKNEVQLQRIYDKFEQMNYSKDFFAQKQNEQKQQFNQ